MSYNGGAGGTYGIEIKGINAFITVPTGYEINTSAGEYGIKHYSSGNLLKLVVNGTLNATGTNAANSYGCYTQFDMSVSGDGNATFKGAKNGINVDKNLEILSSTVTAEGTTDAGIYAAGELTITDGT
jgi:hypothetical protein